MYTYICNVQVFSVFLSASNIYSVQEHDLSYERSAYSVVPFLLQLNLELPETLSLVLDTFDIECASYQLSSLVWHP